MKLHKYLHLVVFSLGLYLNLYAQNPCNYTAGYTCNTAPIICDLSCLDGFVGMTPNPTAVVNTLPEQPSVICDLGGSPQNMSWFAFIAGSNHAKISITPFNCENNKGVQAGIFDDCDFSDAIVNGVTVPSEYIDCEFMPGDMETIVLESFALIPGQIYYFYVDGNEGDVCSYKVDVISATQHFELHNLNNFTQSNDTVQLCPNSKYKLSVDSLKLDIYYYWKINPATPSLPFDTFTRMDSVVTWTFVDTGEYTISLYATNGCDITDTIQKTFKIFPLADEDFGMISRCTNDFPYGGPQNIDPNGDGVFGWQGPNITSPGKDTFLVVRPDGCNYNQLIDVEPIPLQPRETVTLVDCQSFVYHDLILDDNYKNFQHTLPIPDKNGCDSLVLINAYIPRVQASLNQSSCKNGSIEVSCASSVLSSPGGHTLTYNWTDGLGSAITDNDGDPTNVPIVSTTMVNLTILLSIDNKVCSFTVSPISVDAQLQLPQAPQANAWDLELCKDNPIASYTVQGQSGTLSYNWTAGGGAIINGNPTGNVANIDFSQVTNKSTVCATAINECGESLPTCFDVTLLQRPVVDLPGDVSICVDSILNVAMLNTQLAAASYQWDYPGASLISGNPNSYNPIAVRYSNAGNYTLSVSASNKECIATPEMINVTVVPAIAQTQIQYISYANKIEVNWNAVPCAIAYRIFRNGVYLGTTTFTQTTFEQLAPGQSFAVTIEAEGQGCACGVSKANAVVSTLSCDEVSIDLSAADNIICETDWDKPLSLIAQLTGVLSSGVSQWSGPGVLASNEFLPRIAGPGSHKIYFTYSELGCTYKDSINFLNVKTPEASILATDPECEEDQSGSIQVTPAGSGATYNYFLDGLQVQDPNMTGISIGNHSLEIVDGNACKIIKTFNINPPTYPSVSFIMDEGPFYDNQTFNITLKELVSEQSLIDSVEWFVNGELYCKGDCFSTNFTYQQGGVYSHQVVIFYKDCLMEKNFDIVVKETPKVYISNIFALDPRGGENNGWKITSNDAGLKINAISVYSRWGERMFHKENFVISESQPLWDGRYLGQLVLPGVYVYQLSYTNEKGEDKLMHGDLTVIR